MCLHEITIVHIAAFLTIPTRTTPKGEVAAATGRREQLYSLKPVTAAPAGAGRDLSSDGDDLAGMLSGLSMVRLAAAAGVA